MPVKILSVDDSKTIRLIVKRTFAPFDATVLEACNGEEGLAAAGRVRVAWTSPPARGRR